MSLFQFGFTKTVNSTSGNGTAVSVTAPRHMPDQLESGLGKAEYANVVASVSTLADPELVRKRKSKGKYYQYTDEDRAKIGRYACEHGNEKARRRFLNQKPKLSESTVRNFKKRYQTKMREEQKKDHPQPVTKVTSQPRGRPLLMGELDESLLKFLKATRAKGGVINVHVVRATADALIKSNDQVHIAKFDLNYSWVQSIYRRLGYTRRLGTTSRPPVPRGLYEECRQNFLGDISFKVKQHSIPPDLILNADQTPSSYVSVGNQTMALCGAKSVPIKGLTDKRNITLTFVISLSGNFLPMQVIYTGKTKASLPRSFKFPEGFSLTCNPKHWSNEATTLKLIDEVVNPYVVKKRKELKLASTQKALMIWDVFRGQMTDVVKRKLNTLSIELLLSLRT